jgi:hypothetical protein
MRNQGLTWTILVALLIGVLVTVSGIGIDWILHETRRQIFASDVGEGAVAAVMSGIALARGQRRRKDLLIRMQAIEDVNHHVRNALTAITYSAALQHDPVLTKVIEDANQRIDWVLRVSLPQYANAEEERFGEVTSQWSQGARTSNSSETEDHTLKL